MVFPEKFVDFDQIWLKTPLKHINYADMVLIRENIISMTQREKIEKLIDIIQQLGYKVFEEDFNKDTNSKYYILTCKSNMTI